MKPSVKMRLVAAGAMLLGFASIAVASTRIGIKRAQTPLSSPPVTRVTDKQHGVDGHPLAQPVDSREVKIAITRDDVFRSCCRPPDLVVSGKITNLTQHPLQYVRLIIAMKDASGRVVYKEDTYNHGAVTLFEDPELAKMLGEKRHADPLAPGSSDSFIFSIPLPVIPAYKTVDVLASDIVPSPSIANSR